MGEENLETKKNNSGGGGGGGGGNKKKDEPASPNVVFKVNMHCEGCANKLMKCAKAFDGVESAKAEPENSKLTVIGKVDPTKLLEKLVKTTRKEIKLISPLPKKEKNGDGDKKPAAKTEQKIKEAPVTTAVLKVVIHCHGCFEKIQRTASKFKGVHTSSIDLEKDLVTVTGTMDAKALQESLKEKVKRPVEIIPPKKEKDGEGGGGEGGGKKQKGGGKKNEKGGGDGGDGGDVKTEVNLMQHYGYGCGYEYGAGYFIEPVHPPQLFSDENPNACTIM